MLTKRRNLNLSPERLNSNIFSSVFDIEQNIEGPQTISTLWGEFLREYEKELVEAGKREGRKQVFEALEKEAEKAFLAYLSRVFSVKRMVEETTTERLKTVSITDCRAKLLPISGEIDLFFVVNCENYDDDINFGMLTSQMQRMLLTDLNLFAEILYASNQSPLDIGLVKTDYPYSLKAEVNV